MNNKNSIPDYSMANLCIVGAIIAMPFVIGGTYNILFKIVTCEVIIVTIISAIISIVLFITSNNLIKKEDKLKNKNE